MAAKKDQQQDVERVERVERAEGEGSSVGAPLAVTRPKGQTPGVDVSNADVDYANVSLDASASQYHENPDPNPHDLRPAPGPSTVQVLGTGEQVDPARQPGEESR